MAAGSLASCCLDRQGVDVFATLELCSLILIDRSLSAFLINVQSPIIEFKDIALYTCVSGCWQPAAYSHTKIVALLEVAGKPLITHCT